MLNYLQGERKTMDSVKEGIRLNLVELLEKTGKRRSDLAKACGVGKSAVSNWVSGDSSIDVERIPSICQFFNVTIDEFFGRSRQLEPIPELSPDEYRLVSFYRSANEHGKKSIMSEAIHISDVYPAGTKTIVLGDEMNLEEFRKLVEDSERLDPVIKRSSLMLLDEVKEQNEAAGNA